MEKPYRLSCCLYGHTLDVRSLAVSSGNAILSGSRDKSAKFWKPNGFNASYNEFISYKDQKNFVASVLYLEPSNEFPEGLVITGGNDSVILIYKPSEPFATCSIKEHSNTVSCLSKGVAPNSFISGSWDTTAKYWVLSKDSQNQASHSTMKGHTAAVWSVIQLQDLKIVTASADKTICFWNTEGNLIKTLSGHLDCVRGLCDLPEINVFISVSNDASIKLWSYDGSNMDTLYGHTNYIYSVAKCKNGINCFVTSDEDRTVKIWKDGANTQTFQLPAQSVWAVATLENGDIVTGSSDGVVRIFTQDEGRIADAFTLSKYEEEVAALTVQNSQVLGGYKVSDLPGKEGLLEDGKKPGQMKMIREPTGVVAYTWAVEGNRSYWKKVGDVVGANNEDNKGKTQFEGKFYDYVFSVDVEDGKPPLKLPYNIGDDPNKVAQDFLVKNSLPFVYLEQVIQFILKNSNQQQLATTSNEYVDPFTGGSRYTPSGNNQAQFQGTNVDPFTGGSSYSTNSATAMNMQVSTGSNADPFTGGMSYTTASNKVSSYFPQKKYLPFEIGDPNVILNKLKEFNRKVGDGTNSVDENQLELFVSLCKGVATDPDVFDIMFKLLEWPEDMIFPVLDVVRMAVKYEKNNETLVALYGDQLIWKLKHFISEQCSVINNKIVALRTLSNLCLHSPGETLLFNNRFDVVESITSMRALNKNAQVAVATLLLNLTVLCQKKTDDLGLSVLADVIQDILANLSDPESQFRTYVALGTLLTPNSVDCKEVRLKLKTNSNFMKLLNEHNSSYTGDIEKKRMDCAKDVTKLL
ncbi:phospholipase A-2-activating protein [Coccinella septempunctata]|uniref:phospholipase A-2-activating protein n=1 Tax=Coccinella septempunctata TaxID=41139 RepID=UPI001D083311|nr:phospholipase A-2-activating protein [Coccinella septempunctata]